jgi:hypothetical protein
MYDPLQRFEWSGVTMEHGSPYAGRDAHVQSLLFASARMHNDGEIAADRKLKVLFKKTALQFKRRINRVRVVDAGFADGHDRRVAGERGKPALPFLQITAGRAARHVRNVKRRNADRRGKLGKKAALPDNRVA